MITVSGATLDISTFGNRYPENSIERQLLYDMSRSGEPYPYDHVNQLKFELNLRREIILSAIRLNHSDLSFSSFRDSKCNPRYWIRTDNGGFLLREDAKPSEAITNIFMDGGKYATECATAIMIVYYNALLNLYGADLFNETFPSIYLMDWDVREPLLEEVNRLHMETDVLLGDRGYFENPDFNPETPEWRGENVIVLQNSLYYGHGIGITTAEAIIQALNNKRMEDATQSAYFVHAVGRPNFKALFDVYYYGAY